MRAKYAVTAPNSTKVGLRHCRNKLGHIAFIFVWMPGKRRNIRPTLSIPKISMFAPSYWSRSGPRMPARYCFLIAISLASMLSVGHASAQSPESRRLGAAQALKLAADEKVVLDGKIDEAFWSRATLISEFYEYRPRAAPAKFKTEARIAYDADAIYFALRAYDPDPSRIEAPLVRRDQVFGSQDFFAVYLDPVGQRRFAQFFRVNAVGAIGDGLFSEDNQNEDFSPDFEWDAGVARLADGWSAEFRIPFSIMRYSSPPSENWSVFLVRGITRDDVFRIGNGRIPRDSNCLQCYAQTVSGLTGLPAGRELTVTPNLTLRHTRDQETGRADKRDKELVVGVDVKYRPSAAWVLDATLNPDFSQVELDTPQLAANAQFALFFPEKRPFFLEGADILASPFNAIYTRAVNDPAWGLRATYRGEGNDATFMTLRDDGKGLILLPGSLGTNVALQDSKSQVSIARARWFVGTAGSLSLGTVATHRVFETTATKPALSNSVVGIDVIWRPNSDWRFRLDTLASTTRDERNLINGKKSAQDTAALADYNYRTQHWNIAGGLERVGQDFRADSGFFSQVGYAKAYQEWQVKWREVWGFDEIAPYLNIEHKTDMDGNLLYQQNNIGVSLNRPKLNFGFEVRPNQRIRFRNTGGPLKRDQVFFWIDSTPGNWLSSFYLESAIGDRGDVANNRIGPGYYVGMNATIRLFNRWELQPRIDESVINIDGEVPGSKRVIHERAFQLTSIYHLSARDSVRLIGQYNGVRRAPTLYESRKVTPFDKTEVISLVYGHRRGLGTNFYLGATSSRAIEPAATYTRRINEIFIKASYAFDLSRWRV
jgi:hypothetical protein